MHFDVLTLFPELIDTYLESSIMGRAKDKGVFSWTSRQIRDHAIDDYGRVDDTLYGGGRGMLMLSQPVYDSWLEAGGCVANPKQKTLFLSPKGRVFNQSLAKELLAYDQIILLCGHYEGVDQRVLDEIQATEVSLGDFVISGGELGAMAIIDCLVRMLPGTLPDESAFEEESHYHGLLESRQYTKPQVWQDRAVPDVLLSGDHKKIDHYRYMDSLNETLVKRPDMFDRLDLSPETLKDFLNWRKENME